MTARPDDVTADRLLDGQILLDQPRRGFRAGIDTVLLAAAVPARPGDRVIEAGAGAGAATLCLARRVADIEIVGLEKDPGLVRLAAANARRNALAHRIAFLAGDVGRPPRRLTDGSFDHAMMNPPFLPAGRTRPPASGSRAAAKVEDGAGIADWLSFGFGMLRPKGTLTLIHRADRLAELLAALPSGGGEIVVFPLWPRGGESVAKRVLLRARRGSGAPLRLASGLVLHEPGGGFTAEANAVLRGAALDL